MRSDCRPRYRGGRYHLEVLSNRTKISLAQFLALQTDGAIALLCEKHGVEAPRFDYFPDRLSAFRGWLGVVPLAVELG